MNTKIARWGNSLAVRLPSRALKELDLKEGALVELSAKDGKLILEPRHARDPELDELIAAITPKNRYPETNWGKARGREVW